jgi:drug/metabolite transporter (DMT)-like permease
MDEATFQILLGLLISLIGAIVVVYSFMNKSDPDSSESSKSANIQALILGIALLIGGLFYAF